MTLDIENYLPHRQPMLLLDSILEINENSVCCQSLITENNIFYDPTIYGIHAWIGIEFMAQAVGVFAHQQSVLHSQQNLDKTTQEKPKIGFLISVRKFTCIQPHFKLNDSLTIIANKEYLQDNIGVFQCSITLNNKLIASAKLNVFQPSPQQLKKYMLM